MTELRGLRGRLPGKHTESSASSRRPRPDWMKYLTGWRLEGGAAAAVCRKLTGRDCEYLVVSPLHGSTNTLLQQSADPAQPSGQPPSLCRQPRPPPTLSRKKTSPPKRVDEDREAVGLTFSGGRKGKTCADVAAQVAGGVTPDQTNPTMHQCCTLRLETERCHHGLKSSA